jgi:cell division protein FtsL
MRPVFQYLLVVAAVAVIAMFFICQYSRQLRIGYELTHLRNEKVEQLERGRKLRLAIEKAATQDRLVRVARQMGLPLEPPSTARGTP